MKLVLAVVLVLFVTGYAEAGQWSLLRNYTPLPVTKISCQIICENQCQSCGWRDQCCQQVCHERCI